MSPIHDYGSMENRPVEVRNVPATTILLQSERIDELEARVRELEADVEAARFVALDTVCGDCERLEAALRELVAWAEASAPPGTEPWPISAARRALLPTG